MQYIISSMNYGIKAAFASVKLTLSHSLKHLLAAFPVKPSMFGITFVINKAKFDMDGCVCKAESWGTMLKFNVTAQMDGERGLSSSSDVDECLWNTAKSPRANKQIC